MQKTDHMFQNKKVAEEICKRLSKHIPDPKSELNHESEYTFLVAVVMSAQTTDIQRMLNNRRYFAPRPRKTPRKNQVHRLL